MSHSHSHETTVPPAALGAAALLIAICILLSVAVRVGWLEREAVPPLARAQNGIVAMESRDLVFADRPDGAVVIADANTREQVAMIRSDTPGSGFIRGVLRGFARERRMHGIGAQPPFTLTLWQDGSLSLLDTAIGRSVDLGGFGADNRAAFTALLPGHATTGAGA